ncbi:jg10952 [Pararge aegeria aegeria]|uniref:Jg10952 protein n=1 Tax=Pararge aegeria aegeria TaxID=348720 RepID=A0A8S4S794_9NEOP|nr:jg10952 [Pararge aegeria aegeria]
MAALEKNVEKHAKEKNKRITLYPGFPELARSDVSIYPSYTKLGLAYRVVCRHRYHWARVAQLRQFMTELHIFERLQPNALDGVRVHREFSQGILSHKIPSRRYIQKLTPDPMNTRQRMRVEEIISGRVNFSQK